MIQKGKVGRPPRKRKSRIIYLSLEREMADRIAEDAQLDDRTLSGQIERILKKHYGENAKVTV